jgi:[ribosomal protein S18]-alanine N-acetyltransferase
VSHPRHRVTAMVDHDLPAVRAVERATFDDPWSEAGWRQELERDDRRWRTLHLDARVAGFAGLWLAPDAAHVLRLAVEPRWWGRGLGGVLLDELLVAAEEADRPALTLEVRAANDAAIRLYRRRGFVSHGRRPGYYADGEDAVVLWREPGRDGERPSDGVEARRRVRR